MIPAGVFNQGDDVMIIEVRVSASVGMQASIYPAGIVDIEVDWGDGQSQTFTTSGIKHHNYFSAGTYMIKITGAMSAWGVAVTTNKNKVYSIQSWGDLGITNLYHGCSYMTNLNYVATPPAGVTIMTDMLNGASSFNQDISGWDVSNVTNMNNMLRGTAVFNQDLSGWDVSNVTNMTNMFNGATVFNQDLSGWCVINIPTEPSGFSNNTPAWTLPKPVWGTCP